MSSKTIEKGFQKVKPIVKKTKYIVNQFFVTDVRHVLGSQTRIRVLKELNSTRVRRDLNHNLEAYLELPN